MTHFVCNGPEAALNGDNTELEQHRRQSINFRMRAFYGSRKFSFLSVAGGDVAIFLLAEVQVGLRGSSSHPVQRSLRRISRYFDQRSEVLRYIAIR